ncbi:MAG TPA: nucleotidyl transferase AbiEii/AbiGii toxin family protein, partial [Candidatus Hydrogenedentes bacterium]|nr:nucleotidyl transferase AbiEii/AbiGii toxin family protein [Candidatus Hydrogenedentota bacterium]
MKDYYDLWTLARYFSFESDTLARALNATLNRRGRDLSPGMPSGLADEFATNLAKQTQWKAFLRRTIPGRTDLDLGEVVSFLRGFLAPVLEAVLSGNTPHFHWTPERGWADKH